MDQAVEYEIDMKENLPMISEGTINSNLSSWEIAILTGLSKFFGYIVFLAMSCRTFSKIEYVLEGICRQMIC